MLKQFLCSACVITASLWFQSAAIHAASIRSGETKSGTISGPSFLETWTFQGQMGERVVVTAVTTSGFVNTEIYLYPPNGGPAEANTSPFGDKLDHQLQQSGEYTILVQDYLLNDAGNYNISLIKIPGDATSTGDPDGGPLASGETRRGNTAASDMDAFQFLGQAGERVVITAATTSGFLNTELYLYPPNSGPLEASTSPFGDKLDHLLQQTGTYTVIVQDYLLDDAGAYNMSLIKIPGVATSVGDPDGGPITSGETRRGSMVASDLDAFQFTGQAGERVVITAATTSGFLNTELYLYPPNSGPLEADTSPFGDKLDHRLQQAGLYTVIVQDYLLDDAGAYNLTLIKIPGEAASTNDPDGGKIASGETLRGSMVASDLDAFQFFGQAGERIIATVARTSGFLNTELYLYPPEGGDLEADTSPFGDKLDHQLEKTGVYTVIVHDYNLDDNGNYNFTLIKIPGPVSTLRDLDGGDIAPGGAEKGKIGPSDMDAFQFYGQAGDRIVVTASTTMGSLNTELYLYPPEGGPEEANTAPFGDRLDHQLLRSGLYTVIVHDYNLDDEGDYNLTLVKIPEAKRPGIYNPSPRSEIMVQPFDSLRWEAVPGATGYDLYFGVNVLEPLQKIGANVPAPVVALPPVEDLQIYYWQVRAHTPNGEVKGPYWWLKVDRTSSVASQSNNEPPALFELSQNYPNPFNPSTTIRYALPQSGHVKLVIYDLLGAKIRTLADGREAAGFKQISWDGANDRGERVPSGVYVYRMEAGEFVRARKLTVMK